MLTDKQKENLNSAIYEYLQKNTYPKTAESFKLESGCETTMNSEMKVKDVLEKKWVSILRLMRKITDLEATVALLNDELKNISKMKRTTANSGDSENFFPKFPPKQKFTGHKGMVNKVAFHPVYSTIASVGEDASIKLWDFESGKYEGSLKGHTATINAVAFNPDGVLIATGSSDLSIKVWDLDSKNAIKTMNGHDHVISSVDWKPSGDFLLSASRDNSIKLWELATGYCIRTYEGHAEWVRVAVFNGKGNRFASGSNDQTLMLWEESKESPILTFYGHEHVIESIIFCKNEESKKVIHYAKWNEEAPIKENLSVIERSKMKLSGETKKEENYEDIDFLISASRDKSIRIWSCQTGTCLRTINGHSMWVRGLSMHHSGLYFYSCSEDKSIRVWSLKNGKCHRKIENAHSHFVSGIASHPIYLVVVSCSVDSTVLVWECK